MSDLDLAAAPVAVLLFTLKGCPACAAAKPIFDKVAAHYGKCVPGFQLDASMHEELCKRYGVKTAPAVLVVRKGRKVSRLVAATSLRAIENAFIRAARGTECAL